MKERNITYSALFEREIKDTIEDKFAEAVIQLLDFAKEKEIDLDDMDDYIKENTYKELFFRNTFTERVFEIIEHLITGCTIQNVINIALCQIFSLTKSFNCSLMWFIERRVHYNEINEPKNK